MAEIFSTGFIFGVGFVCGVLSCLLFGGKCLEFLGFGRVRFIAVRRNSAPDVQPDRRSSSRSENAPEIQPSEVESEPEEKESVKDVAFF